MNVAELSSCMPLIGASQDNQDQSGGQFLRARKRAGDVDVDIASDEEVDDNDDGDDEDLKLSSKWSITNTIVMMSVATDEGPFAIIIVIIVIHHCLVAGNLAARTRLAQTWNKSTMDANKHSSQHPFEAELHEQFIDPNLQVFVPEALLAYKGDSFLSKVDREFNFQPDGGRISTNKPATRKHWNRAKRESTVTMLRRIITRSGSNESGDVSCHCP